VTLLGSYPVGEPAPCLPELGAQVGCLADRVGGAEARRPFPYDGKADDERRRERDDQREDSDERGHPRPLRS
jgi:hypothetical protein